MPKQLVKDDNHKGESGSVTTKLSNSNLIGASKDAESGGHGFTGVGVGGRVRRGSVANSNADMSGVSEMSSIGEIDVERVNLLKALVNNHCKEISKLLLSSKEHSIKREQINTAFRQCRDAFMEVSTVFLNTMAKHSTCTCPTKNDIKMAVKDALGELKEHNSVDVLTYGRAVDGGQVKSYASVVRTPASEVRVSGGPTVGIPNTTSFVVVPDKGSEEKYVTSRDTKAALCEVLKPSDFGLKVDRISFARKNCVKIEALSPDIERIKNHPELAKIGLKVIEDVKLNPRLIIYGIPVDMTSEEIKNELIAQNLTDKFKNDMKVVYIFPAKQENYELRY